VVLICDAQPADGTPDAVPEPVPIGDGLWARITPGCMAFHGDIDLLTERPFRCAVTTQARIQTGPLVLDLTGLRYLDSGGLGALYAMSKDPEVAFSVRIRAGSIIERVLVFSGLDRTLTLVRIEG